MRQMLWHEVAALAQGGFPPLSNTIHSIWILLLSFTLVLQTSEQKCVPAPFGYVELGCLSWPGNEVVALE